MVCGVAMTSKPKLHAFKIPRLFIGSLAPSSIQFQVKHDNAYPTLLERQAQIDENTSKIKKHG